MNDNPEDSGTRDDEDIDPGEPVAALAGFERDTSSGLIMRIRHTIQRRTTLGQLTSFSADMPLLVLREFWSILIEGLNPVGTRKDTGDGEKVS
jgi:hypothetical protein